MNAQLQELSTGEIEALITEARDVLHSRKAQEEHMRREEKRANAGEGGSWLEHELVNCGNCPRCGAGGRHHGPYWYIYHYTGSRMVSRYIGRALPEKVAKSLGREGLAHLRPETAFPDSYPELVRKEV